MRSGLSLAVCGLLFGAFAMAGCGDDDGGGSGGAGGAGGSTSSSSSTSASSTSSSSASSGSGGEGGGGGEGGAAEGGGGAGGAAEGGGGAGGTPDIGPGPEESCSGCARLAVPLTAASTGTLFQFDYPDLIDLTGAIVTFRVKAHAATGGGVQTYVQNGGAQNWAGVPWAWTNLSDLGEWTELTINVDEAAAANATFDKAAVRRIGIKVDAGTEGPWANPTVVYIDSITVTRSGGTSGEGGAGGTSGEGGAGGTTGEDGASSTTGEGGASSTTGVGGAGGTSGEGGAGSTAGAGGAGGTSGEGGASSTTGVGGAGGTSGEGGAGGASGEVVHVVGPFEFTSDLQGLLLGDYMTVPGSRVDYLGE
ncbi:hypothetical protein [Sorangium sp. So ce406]|uniref:hypothetical protein n=1 Tax=Sorangium sp. So ce406 TaxID=3133311 RepID=UPI003F5B76E9